MRLSDKWSTIKAAIQFKLNSSKVDAANARLIEPKGLRLRFNRLMAMHRTKVNMLVGLSSFVIAAFYGHIIIGFVVLGLALFTAEWLSGGSR